MTGPAAAVPENPQRPSLAYRVGVTGSRRLHELPDEAQDAIRRQVAEVLELVTQEAAHAAAAPRSRDVYCAEDTDGSVRPRLRVISPLADGADRVVAEVATSLGFTLDVALPFPRDVYAHDFGPESRAAFDRWLGTVGAVEARPFLALDGARGDEENRSYEAVGRLVVRNCDLLIAIWDGTSARGRGGTADIVRFAARFGPPVWWIDAAGSSPPRLIRSSLDFRWPDQAPDGDAAKEELRSVLHRALEPPKHQPPEHGHCVIGFLMEKFGLHRRHPHAPPDAWVGWYFNAVLRAAPLPAGTLKGERLEGTMRFVRAKLIAGQVAYHAERERVSRSAGARLGCFGEAMFLVTVVIVLTKLAMFPVMHAHGVHDIVVVLGALAAFLPALSAASVGIRAYAELELLEGQSARLRALMEAADHHLELIAKRLDRPLASQDLAAEVFDVATEMLQDVGGWADLFRVKAVEAG